LATLFASHAFTWRDILAHPRIVFVDLSDIVDPAKGIVAELVLAEIEMDVIRREHSKRKKIPYYVYIDEFTDFMHAGDSTNALFAKARKNWLGFTLAHQTRENFKGDLEGVIMRNTKTRIIMKANAQDARWYTQELQRFDPDATQAEPRAKAHQVSQGSIISAILQNLQVGQAIVRLEVEGVPHCVPVSIPRFK